MTNEISFAEGFTIPLEAVTETFAILAKRGSGKTSTAVVLTEELLTAGQQVIIVDPTGVWWGLRAGEDGTPGGLPVVIVGGEHADIPISETAGSALAKLLVQERQSAVLDLSELSKSATRRLMTDFLETLYRVNLEPLHLIVDEADLLAPQRLPKEMTRLLGAMDDVVRRGRAHGLGVTLISQRPAVLNKDVLGQAEVLIALRMTSPRDVAAIDEWVRLHADSDQAAELKKSLPALPVGTAWIWSPGWLERLDKVQIRRRRTFDSSATPKPGRPVRRPTLRTVDVDRLRQQLETIVPASAAAVSPATANAESLRLRAQVKRLEKQIVELNQRPREVPVEQGLDARTKSELAAVAADIRSLAATLMSAADRLSGALGTKVRSTARNSEAPSAAHQPPRGNARLTTSAAPAATLGSSLKRGARRMLEVLADHQPRAMSRAQLALLARMKSSSGTYSSYLSTLRTSGYIAEDDRQITITPEGMAHLGVHRSPPVTAEQVREQWRSALKAGARRMFDALVEAHPGALSRQDLAEIVEITPTSGTFSSYLSTLRTNGLMNEDHGLLTASQTLFMEPE